MLVVTSGPWWRHDCVLVSALEVWAKWGVICTGYPFAYASVCLLGGGPLILHLKFILVSFPELKTCESLGRRLEIVNSPFTLTSTSTHTDWAKAHPLPPYWTYTVFSSWGQRRWVMALWPVPNGHFQGEENGENGERGQWMLMEILCNELEDTKAAQAVLKNLSRA